MKGSISLYLYLLSPCNQFDLQDDFKVENVAQSSLGEVGGYVGCQ